MDAATPTSVQVAVRVRPLNKRELDGGAHACVHVADGQTLTVAAPDATLSRKRLDTGGGRQRNAGGENGDGRHRFAFDMVFGPETTQDHVYARLGAPVLEHAFNGFNGTIFAYGQTASGKTHTMMGFSGTTEPGIIPRVNKQLFERVRREVAEAERLAAEQKRQQQAQGEGGAGAATAAGAEDGGSVKQFLVVCSFFEIYNEFVYDLLDPNYATAANAGKGKRQGLQVKENSVLGVYVKDLRQIVVTSADKVASLMREGSARRSTGATNMNERSSRSHSIFRLTVHQKDALDAAKNVFAEINLVDLAGSERASRTGATGARLKEGANINTSLSALGNVINALAENAHAKRKQFVPYRNSKLTRVLQQSLGGNALCTMMAAVSPAGDSFGETMSTLRYANRAKSIQVAATKNSKLEQMERLQAEVSALKARLAQKEAAAAAAGLAEEEKRKLTQRFQKQIEEPVVIPQSTLLSIERPAFLFTHPWASRFSFSRVLAFALLPRDRMNGMMARNTFEATQRLSAQYEAERKAAQEALARERRALRQRVEQERAKRRALLRERGDLELLIRDLGIGDPGRCDAWAARVARVRALAERRQQQCKVVEVYRRAFEADVARQTHTHTHEYRSYLEHSECIQC